MQISQESTCFGVFFNKVAGPQNCNFIKKRLQHGLFPVNFVNHSRISILSGIYKVPKHQCTFLKTPFLQNISSGCFWQWLLLLLDINDVPDEVICGVAIDADDTTPYSKLGFDNLSTSRTFVGLLLLAYARFGTCVRSHVR